MNGNALYATSQAICRFAMTTLYDLKVVGTRHVPRTGGCLIVANHQSFLDPVVIGCQLHRPSSFFAKSELFENRYFGWLIRKFYAFPVRQGEGDIGAVREAIRRLQEGHALVVFAEGSRTENGEMLPLEPGISLIVRKAGVPVVPCLIDGSYQAWPRQRKLPGLHPIRVEFGPPMKLDHLKSHAMLREVEGIMHRMFEKVRADLRQDLDERRPR